MDRYLEFAANHTLLMAALVFSFFLLVITELRRKASGIVNVEPQDAVKLINNDAVVIDLRSPEAFARGHIVHAKNIPMDELDAKNEKIAGYRGKPVVTVCESGANATRAVDRLRKSGFESVYGLKGGIAGWTQANLPLVTSKKTRKKS
jgi:rhodanese-related sulfurtransferase